MTRIRDWFITLRSKRSNLINRNETVSFDSFTNEAGVHDSPKIRESTLSHKAVECAQEVKADNYQRFSENEPNVSYSRPSCVSLLLLILLMIVFLILPVIYLLHCFDLLNAHWQRELVLPSNRHLHPSGEVHYSPGSRVHELLNEYEPPEDATSIFASVPNARKKTRKSLPFPNSASNEQCSGMRDVDRFDCYPEAGANQGACEERGCCWAPASPGYTSLNVPYCFYPNHYGGYKILNVSKTAYGLDAYIGRTFKSPYPGDVHILRMIVKFEEQNRLHVKMVDAENSRFESPYPEVPLIDGACRDTAYSFVIDHNKTGFKVVRKEDNTVIFDAMDVGGFIYANQFLQLSARLPSRFIYGLGEHRTRLLLPTHWNRLTLFTADQMPFENLNLYGAQPMYLSLEPSGKAHGVFLLNSNAMDVILQESPAITFRTIGGVLDFYFLLGPTPADVVRQYSETVGKPALPPLWGLGFHLCRYGYKTLDRTRFIMQRNLDAGIPLDVQWNDLDYMESNNGFTYNKTTFKDLPQFVEELHSMGMHYVPLIDPGVSGAEPPGTYPPYDKGLAMNIFVLNTSSQPFIGKVWNTKSTVWPDFTNPSTLDYWTTMIRSLHESFAFDGAWIDMNEPSNFLSGSTTGCPASSLEQPPYVPAVNGGKLNFKTMCMSARQYAGLHYDVHNLYGISEATMTSFAMAEVRGKRPFVISRSSFLGLGRYSGHWSGDVMSSWDDMSYSIPDMLTFSIFNIPLMGADICGFNGNTTSTLCQRWMQLGAFYPFSRNHNTDNGIDQDPAAFSKQVLDSSRTALRIRYSLLPYLYTLFYKAHAHGDTVARPLFFEFANDSATYDIDDQFLWGPSLMICPVLQENANKRSVYFPSGRWYDWYSGKVLVANGGRREEVSAPLDTIPLYIRGGSVLAMQQPAANTHLMRNHSLQLLAASDGDQFAAGHLYWDDGDSLNSVEELRYTLLEFKLRPGELITIVSWLGAEKPPTLARVTILGLTLSVTSVTINGHETAFHYDGRNQSLQVEKLNVPLTIPVSIQWK